MTPAATDSPTPGIDIHELHRRLTRQDAEQDIAWPRGRFTLDEANGSIAMVLEDYEGLSATITQQAEQWVIVAPIVAVEGVARQDEFNRTALRLGMLLPLASIGISEIDGEEYYIAYGQLYSESKLSSINSDIHATACAALQVAEMLRDELK